MLDKDIPIQDHILNIFYPNKCIFCKEIVPLGEYACTECSKELPRPIADNTDDETSEENQANNEDKSEAFINKHEFEFGKEYGYALYYTDPVPNGIAEFKFKDRPQLAKYFAGLMVEAMGKTMIEMHINLICCVPMHHEKEKKRGYNQAELLAKELALKMNIRFEKNVLIKIKDNKIQHQLGAEQRRRNVLNVYTVSNKTNLIGKKIVLVDDILTTGSTLHECSRVLKLEGAEIVFGAVVARAVPILHTGEDLAK